MPLIVNDNKTNKDLEIILDNSIELVLDESIQKQLNNLKINFYNKNVSKLSVYEQINNILNDLDIYQKKLLKQSKINIERLEEILMSNKDLLKIKDNVQVEEKSEKDEENPEVLVTVFLKKLVAKTLIISEEIKVVFDNVCEITKRIYNASEVASIMDKLVEIRRIERINFDEIYINIEENEMVCEELNNKVISICEEIFDIKECNDNNFNIMA